MWDFNGHDNFFFFIFFSVVEQKRTKEEEEETEMLVRVRGMCACVCVCVRVRAWAWTCVVTKWIILTNKEKKKNEKMNTHAEAREKSFARNGGKQKRNTSTSCFSQAI